MGATLNQVRLRKYVLSCELLIIPVLVWNIAFTGFLPPALGSQEFWRDIPPMVTYGENLLRLIVLVLSFLMPLDLRAVSQRRGLTLFTVGMVLYFLAWLALMPFPQSQWSLSWTGLLAPAYTPLRHSYGSPVSVSSAASSIGQGLIAGGYISGLPPASRPSMSHMRASSTSGITERPRLESAG